MRNNIEVEICNDAILASGQTTTITSLDENSALGELCGRLWPATLRQMYTEHPWAFRKMRTMLNVYKQGNPHEYSYPDNCLRVLGFYKDKGCQIPEKLARVRADKDGITRIISPYMPLFVEYLADKTSQDSLSPWLRECLVLLLASKIAQAQGKDNTKLLQQYSTWLDRAEENDASEDGATHTYDDRFINCR